MPVLSILKDSIDQSFFLRKIQVNQFSLERSPSYLCTEQQDRNCSSYSVIHPYFLKNGGNDFELDYWVNSINQEEKEKSRQITFILRESKNEGVLSEIKFGAEIVKLQTPSFREISEEQAKHFTAEFQWRQKLPNWSWVSGKKIEQNIENKTMLYAEYKKFWNELKSLKGSKKDLNFYKKLKESTKEYLQASKILGQRDGLDRLMKLAETGKDEKQVDVKISLRDLPTEEEATMTIFAGGALAKLNQGFATMIRYQGGHTDTESRTPSPVKIGYDLWFRKNTSGQWEIDAVVPANGSDW